MIFDYSSTSERKAIFRDMQSQYRKIFLYNKEVLTKLNRKIKSYKEETLAQTSVGGNVPRTHTQKLDRLFEQDFQG